MNTSLKPHNCALYILKLYQMRLFYKKMGFIYIISQMLFVTPAPVKAAGVTKSILNTILNKIISYKREFHFKRDYCHCERVQRAWQSTKTGLLR